MKQHVEIGYGADAQQCAIEVRINNEGKGLQIRANRHGMALMASMVADFLLHPHPASLHYTIGGSHGMKAGCPKLKIQFLDEQEASLPPAGNDVI